MFQINARVNFLFVDQLAEVGFSINHDPIYEYTIQILVRIQIKQFQFGFLNFNNTQTIDVLMQKYHMQVHVQSQYLYKRAFIDGNKQAIQKMTLEGFNEKWSDGNRCNQKKFILKQFLLKKSLCFLRQQILREKYVVFSDSTKHELAQAEFQIGCLDSDVFYNLCGYCQSDTTSQFFETKINIWDKDRISYCILVQRKQLLR
ncbi:unnamed protein product [Paramecium sonneborni]|uniref:Uncharacterized protein n=1 Tax=Paramecium sonneborni TaxID=65129 RepID=A0A8S1RNS4_9CILI|nr:unnamed protein product [Paramecium sonneborni]